MDAEGPLGGSWFSPSTWVSKTKLWSSDFLLCMTELGCLFVFPCPAGHVALAPVFLLSPFIQSKN